MQTEFDTKDSTGEQHRTPPQVTPPPELPPAPPRKALIIVALVILVLALSGALSMVSRFRDAQALAKETDADSVATVVVVHPVAEKPDEELVLPASLQAYEESPIYARTSGYLLRWYKDIGSRVAKGELLADIDTPEIDQELSQARATRQQISAQLELAKISSDRWQSLRKTDSVSQQETDTQTNAYQQALANLAAAEANVRRLEQLESFKHVYAPFAGVLIKRNVDPGALINAGSAGVELFILARVDPLRVFVNVPQAYSPAIKDGMPAYITLPEISGQKFRGTVTRTAQAIDPATRTLLTEVDVPNKDGRLLRGSFGEVHFAPKINAEKVTVPVNAMLFRQEGPRLAIVGADNKVQLRPITIGHDYGTTLEVLGGVSLEDRIIINPADSLEDGQMVNVAPENQAGNHS
ncbi:MAG TPA: efflux RND transporter periplasmic adaptor subunit [Candidatus Sulfotelmatobacter sp.]|jgi:membrane fusion protein, multidrug efflux system|nr:efflux RND transporter periplasmic adaptor subunit [Candidatus Sulfotelmatobacter sp.]